MERSALEDPDCHLVAGHVLVRLRGAPAAIASQLRRELAAVAVAGAQPDGPVLDISFGSRTPSSGRTRLLGVTDGAFAFDDESFHLLDPDGRRLTIEAIEPGRISLRAEHAMRRLPMLPALIGLLLLARGRVLLHAAAFRVGGLGVLVPGWQSGGKSELLLGFAARAMAGTGPAVEYAADEWTVVGRDDRAVTGLPTPVQLWAWQLAQLPEAARGLASAERRRLASLGAARAGTRAALALSRRLGLDEPIRPSGAPFRSLVALDGWLRHAERVVVPAASLGMTERREPMAVDCIVLPTVSERGTWTRPIDGAEVAARMLGSQAFERRALDEVHAKYRYAFPGCRWRALDDATPAEAAILPSALAGVPAIEVAHPYPVDLARFAGDVAAALERDGR